MAALYGGAVWVYVAVGERGMVRGTSPPIARYPGQGIATAAFVAALGHRQSEASPRLS